ncbi:hypothetical protein F5X99DRAFT_400466 [Biscogniauxia marginata]|nr:hypothetical protein F5X99DRAFT_400466 [Biscogniauxia marginata]
MALTLIAIQDAVVLFIAVVLAIIALGLRIWSRRIMKIPLAFNDYMAIAAMILTLGVIVNALVEVFTGGIGVHVSEIMATNPWVFYLYLKLFIAAQLLWAAANSCVKFSILSLYTVIFPNNPKFIYICHGTMAVTTAYLISVLVETFALCHPVQYNWDKTIPGKCEGQTEAFLAAGITNLVVDAFIVALPMPMLFSLKLSLPKRFGVAGMFSLGALICVMSLLRILWLQEWDLSDLTYGVGPGTIWSGLEPTLGIVNACLPTINPALTRIFGRGLLGRTGTPYVGNSKNSGQSRSQERRLPPGIRDTHGQGFERLDDDVPLTNIHSENVLRRNDDEENIIMVTTEWQVNSLPHRSRDPTPSSGRTPESIDI